MKNLFVLIALVCCTINSAAQDHKWSLNVLASPNVYSLKVGQFSSREYRSNLGLSLASEIYFSPHPKIQIGTGFHAKRWAYEVDYDYVFRNPGDPSIPRTTSVKATYIEIPINIRYHVIRREKLNVAPSLGFSTSILANAKEHTTYENDLTIASNYLHPLTYSANAGMAATYHLNPDLSLILEPRFNYYLSTIDELSWINPTAFQVFVGVAYEL